MDFLWLLDKRYQSNPKIPLKIKKYCHYNLKLLEWQIKEDDMPYVWDMTFQIADGLRAMNDRKGNTELEKLNPIFKQDLEKKILTTPESEFDAMKMLSRLKARMNYGAMQDG